MVLIMKTQILKKHNLIVATALFLILGFIVAVNILAVKDNVTIDAMVLFNLVLGILFLLATFGWVQDMRWDAKREKELLREGGS